MIRACRGRVVAALVGLTVATGGCVFVSGDVNPFAYKPEEVREHVVAGEGAAKVLIVDVSGVISTEENDTALGLRRRESTVARIEEELEKAGDDDAVRAVILRIDSPGGTVTASDIIYHRVRRFADEHGVPVVAELMDVAASGGYYVALAADEIVAHPTTMTGSIGVIFQSVSFSGLMQKLGVQNQTVKTGSKKDIGSPLRDMTAEEKALLESMLDEMKVRFVGLVRERRHALTAEAEPALQDGRVLSAGQALAAGLVDRIGYLDDAIDVAKGRAGVKEARVVIYRRPDEFAGTIYSRAALPATQVNLVNVELPFHALSPHLLYLWAP
jgi:protease IV